MTGVGVDSLALFALLLLLPKGAIAREYYNLVYAHLWGHSTSLLPELEHRGDEVHAEVIGTLRLE